MRLPCGALAFEHIPEIDIPGESAVPYVLPEPPGKFALPMTTERINWCLEVLGWSRSELARRLDVSDATASQMIRGKRFTPNRVAVWLESLAQMVRALPTPFLWHEGAGAAAQRHNIVGGSGPEIDIIEQSWDPARAKPRDPAELLGDGE